jgi:hypothetical protein
VTAARSHDRPQRWSHPTEATTAAVESTSDVLEPASDPVESGRPAVESRTNAAGRRVLPALEVGTSALLASSSLASRSAWPGVSGLDAASWRARRSAVTPSRTPCRNRV